MEGHGDDAKKFSWLMLKYFLFVGSYCIVYMSTCNCSRFTIQTEGNYFVSVQLSDLDAFPPNFGKLSLKLQDGQLKLWKMSSDKIYTEIYFTEDFRKFF